MKRFLVLALPAVLFVGAVAVAFVEGACNDVGDCPATITPNASCSGTNLQCPYNLDSPSPACDGTMVDGGIATSCICTDGKWACPDPVACDSGAPADDGGAEAESDADNDDGGGDADTDSDAGGDAGVDAPADAPSDTGVDAPADTGTDASDSGIRDAATG